MEVVALAVLVVVTGAIGMWWRSREGAVRAPRVTGSTEWSAHGVVLADRATFVQFSAEVCSSCRSTARVLGALSDAEPGVAHRELDVEEHLDLVRELGVLRTPTVLMLSPDGEAVARMSGAVTPADARQALEGVTS